jgi:hypothetical protein
LAAVLERVPAGTTLHIDLKGVSYIDHACLTLLMSWEKQHEATGGTLVLDWETLRARFQDARPRPRSLRNTHKEAVLASGGDHERRRAA